MRTVNGDSRDDWGRRLVRAWMVLLGLTLVSVGAALAGGTNNRSGLVAVVVALEQMLMVVALLVAQHLTQLVWVV